MTTAKITKRSVDAVTPGTTDLYLWDSDLRGFGLKVTPAGSRIYLVQYRAGGRTRRVTIARHGVVTPDEARRSARRLLGEVAAGGDPAEGIAATKRDVTVKELCAIYLDEGCATKKPSTMATDRGRITRHIVPLIGRKRVSTVTRRDIERFMADIVAGKTAADVKTGKHGRAIVRGGRGTATRTMGLLGAIFQFAVDGDLLEDNPVRGVKRYEDRSGARFLSPRELAALGRTLVDAEADGENPGAIAAIRLLALTGCRKTELLSLKWAHVDFEYGFLRLPDSKTGAKVVALGAAALEVLAGLPRIEGADFVFPAARGEGHYVGLPKVWCRVRERAGLDDVRLHDLRHSFAAVGANGGQSMLVIGELLGHRDKTTTARYAHLSNDPVRSAADRISREIAGAMRGDDGASVVPLSRR